MQSVLCGGVGPREGRAGLPRGAGHDGDGAAAVGDEVRDDDPGEVDDGEHVQLEHVLVHLEGSERISSYYPLITPLLDNYLYVNLKRDSHTF